MDFAAIVNGVLSGLGTAAVLSSIGIAWLWVTNRLKKPIIAVRRLVSAVILASLIAGLGVGAWLNWPSIFPRHQPCPPAVTTDQVNWDLPVYGGQGDVATDRIIQTVPPCQTLMLTGRSFTYGGSECAGSVTQVCVLLVRSTYTQDVRIESVEAHHTWYGVTTSPPYQALSWQEGNFWMEGNCETGWGCDSGQVLEFLDDELVGTYVLSRPAGE